MRWARLVLAVMLVVGWTSTAAAECAWVVWAKTVGKNAFGSVYTTWDVKGASEDRKRCLFEQEITLANETTFWLKLAAKENEGSDILNVDSDHNEMSLSVYKRKAGKVEVWSTRFICLPDTIDPRERK